MSDTNITRPTPSEQNLTNTTAVAPQPMTWEEQKDLYAELVRKENRTENEQDFLEAVGMAFVLDDIFSEEKPPVTTPEGLCPPLTSPETESGK